MNFKLLTISLMNTIKIGDPIGSFAIHQIVIVAKMILTHYSKIKFKEKS